MTSLRRRAFNRIQYNIHVYLSSVKEEYELVSLINAKVRECDLSVITSLRYPEQLSKTPREIEESIVYVTIDQESRLPRDNCAPLRLHGINQGFSRPPFSLSLSLSAEAPLRSRDTPGYPEKSQPATKCGPLTSSYALDPLCLSLSSPLFSLLLSFSLAALLGTPERRWYGVPYRRFTYI